MSAFRIEEATEDADFSAAHSLCREYVAWQISTFPDKRDSLTTHLASDTYDALLASLAELHARPDGGILIAKRDDIAVGCVMWRRFEPGIAEVKRLFVSPTSRRGGMGTALMAALEAQTFADGYDALILKTATFLDDARTLFQRRGFTQPPPQYLEQVEGPATTGYYKVVAVR